MPVKGRFQPRICVWLRTLLLMKTTNPGMIALMSDVNKTRGSEAAGIDWVTRSGNFGKQTHPPFEMVPTENRQSRWCVPKKFAEAACLIGKSAVVLSIYPSGDIGLLF